MCAAAHTIPTKPDSIPSGFPGDELYRKHGALTQVVHEVYLKRSVRPARA